MVVSVLAIRPATTADLGEVFPRTRALNDHEGIAIDDATLERALRELLASPEIGVVWLVLHDDAPIGYAITTYGYDLEYGGRDATLTELWIDPTARGGGAGARVIALLEPELDARGVHALHLQVRPENPAMRLYERAGFVTSPRRVMTRRLGRP